MTPTPAPIRRGRTATARHTAAARHAAAALAEDGLLIMDSSLNPIAADRGATAILGVSNPGVSAQTLSLLPKELQDMLRDHDPENLPENLQVRIGNAGYNCRTFIIYAQDSEAEQPMMVGLHFKKDASVSNSISRVAALYHLTDREQQALEGIAAGLTSKEIAAGMDISPNTVKSFLRIIMLKMGVATRVGLVRKVLEDKDTTNSDSRPRPQSRSVAGVEVP